MGADARDAVPPLVEALKDSDANVRFQAAEAHCRMGPKARDAVPALREALKDPAERVRKEAAEALERIAGEETPLPGKG